MSLKPLTDLAIQKLPAPEKGQKVYYEPSGLGVRISQGGTKSFVVQLGARRRRRTIGRYPHMSLKDARSEAMRLFNDADPFANDKSVESAVAEFLAYCERKNKPRTVEGYRRFLNKYFPNGLLGEINRASLLRTLAKLAHVPGEQHHASTVFQIFLNWCANNGLIESNPIAGIRKQGHLNKRERVLTDEELVSVWSALPDNNFGTTLRLMILTGQRRSEIPHFEIEDGIARISGKFTKNNRDHQFPIGDMTLQHLGETCWNGWAKSKRFLDEKSGVTDWRLHDLRRTFATNHARLETPIHVIEKYLNHVSGSFAGVSGVYNRYSYMDEMRQACNKYENWLASQCS